MGIYSKLLDECVSCGSKNIEHRNTRFARDNPNVNFDNWTCIDCGCGFIE